MASQSTEVFEKHGYSYVIKSFGHAGTALAARIEQTGGTAIVDASPNHRTNYNQVKAAGYLKTTGKVLGDTKYYPVLAPNTENALTKSTIVVETTPSDQRGDTKRELVEAGKKIGGLGKHTIVYLPDNGSSLIEEAALTEEDCQELGVRFAVGLTSSPYGSRYVQEEQHAFLKFKKNVVELSIYQRLRADGSATEEELKADLAEFPLDEIRKLFTGLGIRQLANALEAFLENPNLQNHGPAAIGNIGRIEQVDQRFTYYRDGMSPGLNKVKGACDQERQKVGKLFGFEILDVTAWMNMMYITPGMEPFKDYDDFAKRTISHNATMGDPQNLEHRYFTEDLLDQGSRFCAIARKFEVDCSTTQALVTIAKTATGKDVRSDEELLTEMGLWKMTAAELVEKYKVGGWGSVPQIF